MICRESHDELVEIVEDMVEKVCNDYLISGETAWKILSALSEAKLKQLSGEID